MMEFDMVTNSEAKHTIERCHEVLDKMTVVRDMDYGLNASFNAALRCDKYERLIGDLAEILKGER